MPFVGLILIGLPLLEIAGFVIVGSKIGVLWTIALVILSSIVGSTLLRVQGFSVVTRIRRELEAGRDPGRELADGAMIMLAGILLLIPGFVSDILGLLLFIPPVREFVWRLLKRRIVVSSFGAGFDGFGTKRRGGKTIDLDSEDFSRTPDPKSPWRIDSDRR
ncbi:FxsA family protein [Mesorhizobium sp. BAC0120]|uniref:FxsA family protein n=1 Tax=Mesorhizobium sp. BAC0120 TaxID=3090670 RepID=UPI00298CDE44|nr:FxsA family protein [Mesorhizobium sp. BAC0120]MDW6024497.1 FxsA family protein [Mesorhizobium sp. BAC0120]